MALWQKAQGRTALAAITNPTMEPLGGNFAGRVTVTIRGELEGCSVVGTMDGSEPNVTYCGPGSLRGPSPFKLVLVKSAPLKFLTVCADGRYSPVTSQSYTVHSTGASMLLTGGVRSVSKITGRATSLPTEVALDSTSCGVGILFDKLMGGQICVHRLVPGGAADRDGRIQRNDMVLSVDGQPMAGLDIGRLQNLVKGNEGTQISILFQRAAPQLGEQPLMIEAVLTRGPNLGPFALEGIDD